MDHIPAYLAALTSSALAQTTPDELQSVLVALFALIVRELLYWFRNRRS